MDPQAYAYVHQNEWKRLAALSRKRALDGSEVDELLQLYQRGAGELAQIRRTAPDPELILHLSALLGEARSRLTQRKSGVMQSLVRLFGVTLPVAFYRLRWWALAVTAACVLLAVGVYVVYAFTPGLVDTLGSPRAQEQYATRAFEAYYSEYSNSDFSAMVWTNNAWVALQCVAGGITGIWPIYVLGQNSVALGQSAIVMDQFDRLGLFFQLILPHGQLELMSIFFAGAAGLKLFWTFVHPGKRPRIEALGQEGLHTVTVAIGLVFVLFVSGLVEGFVTPSNLPWPLKIAIGTLVLVAFWLWVIMLGKRGEAIHADDESFAATHIEYA
ncbi:MAG: stage II sporulation protein M [Actinomycetaceae bacterium]|nr:stage II sporulation protein M [Arcanobacterium sp.]MDD7505167.1 stage II sporulation protein M [Actinomycetaceae bacterium]MDY6143843.1 stage II sporulation protein M [Arcanobacterium sp.]